MNNRLLITTILACGLAACGSTRDPNHALEQARNHVLAAQNDTQVLTLAPTELKQAQDSLGAADKAWTDGGPAATIDHLAYMTTQRVVIAQETASNKASQAVSAGAAAERDKTRLALRTQEADTAKQQLAVADAAATLGQARVSGLEMQLRELHSKETDRGTIVTLGDMLFDTGQARLTPASTRHLTKLAAVFKTDPQRRASIEGFTDNTGSETANLELSQRRADAVMTALLDLGVSADLLTTRAHGQALPAASNGSAAGRQMNRRVEIVFAKQAAAAPTMK